jgi:TatD DNase family protein
MQGYIDSHAHITSKDFDSDRADVLQRAFDAGVNFVINPSTDLEDSKRAVDLAEKYPQIFACVGIHPHEAVRASDAAVASIEDLTNHPKVVGIGEIGLDFYYDFSPRIVQTRIFRAQLEIARRRNLPVVIHTRDSLPETFAIVRESTAAAPEWRAQGVSPHSRYPAPKGVFHCFSGNISEAWQVIRLGFAISFPGVITFANAGQAAAVASGVSLEHILLETDSPYLAPVPFRGTRNEPMHVVQVADRLAQLQHLSVEDVVRSTSYGVFRVFGIGRQPLPQWTYKLRNSLYINLTIRCNADCIFCDRKGDAIIKGNNLRIEREPSAEEVIQEIGEPTRFDEIVFCGYGEPTIRLEVMKQVARWVKEHGGKTRLNTDGHGNIINKRNIVPELVGLIDAVSISLNSTDPHQYGEMMRLDGERFFSAMVEFARECVKTLPRVLMTVVDLDTVNMDKARQLVEKEIGAVFQIRPFF